MKKQFILRSFTGCALVLFALSACRQPEQEKIQYVSLSQAGCTFPGTGGDPLVITVETSPARWTTEVSASWVKAEPGADGTTLVLSVDDNPAAMERSATVTVKAARASQQIAVCQLAPDLSINRFRKERAFQNGGVVSPGGRYIGGFTNKAMGGDAWDYHPVIIDTETGERIDLGPFPSSLLTCSQPFAITDYGQLFISDHRNGGSILFELNGNYMLSGVPEGCVDRGCVMGVSADGSKWVGYARREKQAGERLNPYCPVIWENGRGRILPLPAKNFKGQEFVVGAMARGISADGSVVYGTTWENSDGAMIYWKEDRVRYVGEDVHEIKSVTVEDETFYYADGMVCQAEIYKMSPSGEWISGAYQKIVLNDDYSVSASVCPAFYNTETEKTVVLEEFDGAKGVHVTDEGIAFIALPMAGGMVYDLDAGVTLGTVAEWVYAEYGLIIPSDIFIKYVSPDGRVVLGTGVEQPAGSKGRIYPWYIIPPTR